jgi:hypothetical protein
MSRHGENSMRGKWFLLASLLLAASAYGKELKAYQDATLLQMDSVQCGKDEKNANKTRDILCQEYELQTDQVAYRIRPKDNKHPVLLPVGESAKFRLQKGNMLLCVESLDSKERQFFVLSVKPRGENSADATPARVNHLQ